MSLVLRNLQRAVPLRRARLHEKVQVVTATHGLRHLLGFTHSTEAEWQKRYQKEKQVLEELSRHKGTRFQPLSRGLF
ncbi:endoribonuclease YbeY-like isoform X3 [Balaenoptera ricei]|uniref:Endoribonuclease YbeY-like isoform X3 n=1 Tax=Balaenoptera acutorostrata TaxID=9767 RepID=A0A452C317_BALAC|nr:endoribonuclease YbeY-like isoform X3 [Balaenoptera acutorostrata]XP_059788727.1 endoribonuclease YbeY-like isoform X3 [Balaenoptera ricei]